MYLCVRIKVCVYVFGREAANSRLVSVLTAGDEFSILQSVIRDTTVFIRQGVSDRGLQSVKETTLDQRDPFKV